MFDKNNKKLSCHHGALAWTIAVFLGFILIVLIFKTGMMAGSKSHFSSRKAGNYHKNFSGHMEGKLSSWKKSSYSSYKVVTKLTESGFVVKGSDGEEQVVVVSENTVISKGEEKTGNAVSVGDKVYIVGSVVEASMVKIYDSNLKELKK